MNFHSRIEGYCDCKLRMVLRTSRASTNLQDVSLCVQNLVSCKKYKKSDWFDPKWDNTWYKRQLCDLYRTMKEMQSLEEKSYCKIRELEQEKSKVESQLLQLRMAFN